MSESLYIWYPGSTDFEAGASWVLNGTIASNPPGPGDIALIGGANGDITGTGDVDTLTIQLGDVTLDDSADITATQLFLSGNAFSANFVTISGGTLDASEHGNIDQYTTVDIDDGVLAGDVLVNAGSIDVSGDGILLPDDVGNNGSITVGDGGEIDSPAVSVFSLSGGTAALVVQSGGTVNNSGDTAIIGFASGNGYVEIDSGGTWTSQGDLDVADNGAGTLNVAGGAVGVGGDLFVGYQAAGSLSVSSGGSIAVTGSAAIGIDAAGAVSVSEGDVEITGATTLGAGNGGNGSLTIGTGGTFSTPTLEVGVVGQASLDIDGGDLEVEQQTLTMGLQQGSSGDMSVEQVTFSLTGTVVVGDAGNGTLSIESQGAVTATAIVVGQSDGSNSTLAVDGTGSSAQSDNLTIGDAGTGALQVTGGADLQTLGDGIVGAVAGPMQQSVSLDSGGVWQVGDDADIGQAGTAAMTIKDGARLGATDVLIGVDSGANGTIAMVGTSSATGPALIFGSTLAVAQSGSGTLEIGAHSTVGPAAANTGTIDIGTAGSIVLTGAGATLSGASLDIAGVLTIGAGGMVTIGNAVNGGTVTEAGGTLRLTGGVTGSGLISLDGAALSVGGTVGAGEQIAFSGTGNVVTLGDLAAASGVFSGFGAGDTIVLANVLASGGTFGGGALTLSAGSLAFAGSYTTDDFQVTQASGDTDITYVGCFAEGTRIQTPGGPVAVECLAEADTIVLAAGGTAPIRWIGRRHIVCRSHPQPRTVWPVRVAADAFGPNVPDRDLYLSPDHAIHVNSALIPVKHLINGSTIAQVPRDRVTYYHFELPHHDVVLADGLPVESFLDIKDGANYLERSRSVSLHPEYVALMWEALGCAPLVVAGPELERARALVAAFAADRRAADYRRAG